jgi:outer membrane protein assembly factor BamB
MFKLFCSSLVLSTVFWGNLSALAQPIPKLRQGMTYQDARTLLIEEGWQAIFNMAQFNNSERGAVIDSLIEKGYTEVVDCSGTGLGLCLFQVQNATGETLFVSTTNNAPARKSVVFGWRLEAPATTHTFNFIKKIRGSISRFGNSVAIDGSNAIIGSDAGDNSTDSGAAYLFDLTTGSLLWKFEPTDGDWGDQFGFSVAIHGNKVLISSSNGNNGGSVYLFDINTKSLLWKLTAPDGNWDDEFGNSVAIDGNYALIGSWLDDDKGDDSGAAYLFDVRTGSLLQKFLPPDGYTATIFGHSLVMDGHYALIGSGSYDDVSSVYLFNVKTGSLLQKFTAPDSDLGYGFGRSLAIDGDYALIGSWTHDEIGSAYLFNIKTGSLLRKFIPPEGDAIDAFGLSVAIDGNYAIIGSSDDNQIGSAYLFDIRSGSLLQRITAPDGAKFDAFSSSIAIDGNNALISSPFNEGPGSVYLFRK